MKKELTLFQLKCITIAMMICGMGMIRIVESVSRDALNSGAGLSDSMSLLYLIGYAVYLAAFPLAAFLLVEAAKHTSDRKKLLTRLLIAACVAEIPMDFVNFGLDGLQQWGKNQNYFFTMVIGLGVIMLVETVAKKYPQGEMANTLITLVIYIVAVMIAVLLRAEQGNIGVLTMIALYLLHNSKKFYLFVVLALYIVLFAGSGGVEFIPALSLFFTWMYYGHEGKKTKWTRIIFYAAYPVAFCVFGVVAKLL